MLARRYRTLFAFGCLCFFAFFGALAVGMGTGPVGSPTNGLLEYAVLLMFLGFAIGFFAVGVRMLFARHEKARSVPAPALARCLVCGELASGDETCPRCGEPPSHREALFHVEREGSLAGLAVFLVSGGIAGLGAGIAVGPYLEGERRVWALIVFGALGLSLVLTGGVGAVLSLSAVFKWLGGHAKVAFTMNRPGVDASGTGTAKWGKLVSLQGSSRISSLPAASTPVPARYREPFGDLPFAEMLATFDAAGIVTLRSSCVYEWRLDEAFHRTETRAAVVIPTGAIRRCHVEGDDLEFELTAVHRFVSRWLEVPMSLTALHERMSADRAHRAQAELHARALRERGIPLSGALVDAVLTMLQRQPTV